MNKLSSKWVASYCIECIDTDAIFLQNLDNYGARWLFI